MSGNSHCFVEWKEQFVSQERGNRVVHYFLKDSAGEFILAIVGTERSVRHMFYVVADEFVQAYGAEHSIHAGFKWRSRREVVDWLTSMLSKQHVPGVTDSPKHDPTLPLGLIECPLNRIGAQQTQASDHTGCLPRNGCNLDIVWSGVAWTCGKQLKHYPAFSRNGTTIKIQSFVFVMAKGELRYLAYLEDMYEDKKGQKKVKVRWFHHNQEVRGVIPLRNHHPKEVFITPYAQVISAECVDGPAIVLTREHYDKCFSTFPHSILAKIHMCFRQFKSNRVKPFDLSKLRGYFDQPIVSCLDTNPFPNTTCHTPLQEEGLDLIPEDKMKLGAKRTRNCKEGHKYVRGLSGVRISSKGRQMRTYERTYSNLKYGLSGRRLLSNKHVHCQPWCAPLFKVDEKVELLCQDSGIRGCWFRCTILRESRKLIKVRYDDVQDEDECGNLEEWIPAFKLALPDKLGMRCSGRPIIRPFPTPTDESDLALVVGAAVDAWWSDGWWEGVVTEVGNSGDDDILQIYFPGESLFLNMHKKDLRISRDWVANQWIEIEPKPDILSIISSISPETKLSASSTIVKDSTIVKEVKSDEFMTPNLEIPQSIEQNIIEGEKPNSMAIAGSDEQTEAMDWEDDKKPPSIKDNGTEDHSDGADINCSRGSVDTGDVEGKNDNKIDGDGGRSKVEDMLVSETLGENCKSVDA